MGPTMRIAKPRALTTALISFPRSEDRQRPSECQHIEDTPEELSPRTHCRIDEDLSLSYNEMDAMADAL